MNSPLDKDDIHLRLLRMVEADPHITQREMKRRLGISLGMVNFFLAELSKQGLVRMDRFRKASNKAAYMYHLTPAGMEAIGRLAFRFLKRKVAEYEEIRNQIQAMNDMLQEMDTGGMDDPDLLQQVGRIIG
jgi:EPS-associated MarR family transcriptional regulator